MQIGMIGDKILPIEQVDPIYFDRGFFFGDGVYEVLRSYNGVIFAIREHLERFENSLAAIEIDSVDIDLVRRRVLEAFESAGISEAKIYFHITRGSGPREHGGGPGLEPAFFLTVTELKDHAERYRTGLKVSTHPDWRWARCDIKSLNLLPNVLARRDADRKGCDEAILVRADGLITEGSASAFFAVIGDTLQTAPLAANILPSVTRKYVINAAGNLKMNRLEELLTVSQAEQADELFIASTTMGIVPVVAFDGTMVGHGKPGEHTKRLSAELDSLIKKSL